MLKSSLCDDSDAYTVEKKQAYVIIVMRTQWKK